MAGGFNTEGFVLPENNFAGLYKIGDDLAAANKLKAKEKEDADKAKLAGSKYINNVLGDSKALYTGTPYDPLYTKNINDAHTQAEEMFNQGVDYNSVLMAIQPLISQANNYATAAKDYQLKKKISIENIGNTPGIDKNLFSTEMDNQAFPKDKNGIPDINQYDANLDYGDLALKNGNVYNNEGINNFISKNPGKITNDQAVTVRDANGRTRQTKADITMAPFMQPEKDASGVITGFVPKYDIATDGDQQLMHQVGEQSGQPVRMVTDEVFNSLPATAQAYIRQETKKITDKSGVPLNSLQAEHLAKAIAYDELNSNGKNSSTIKEINVDKEALPDNYYAHRQFDSKFYGAGGGGAVKGNALNGIQLQPNQPDGQYTMGGGGNKQNLGELQNIFGKKLLPDYLINSTDPSKAINYSVKNGQVEAIQINGKWYDRTEVYNMQLSRDKEPLKGTHQSYDASQSTSKDAPVKIKNNSTLSGKVR